MRPGVIAGLADLTATTEPTPATPAPLTFDDMPVKRIRLEVSVELYAYVPVDWEPTGGRDLRDRLEADLEDAIDYHGGRLGDFEDGDALLITEETSVSVNVLEDAEPDPDLTVERLSEWVGARAYGC